MATRWACSRGAAYPQDEHTAIATQPPAGACVYPSEAQIVALCEALHPRAGAIISIGAGLGHLEGLLAQCGAPTLQVVAVDLDVEDGDIEAYMASPCYCDEVRRVRRHELFDVRAHCATLTPALSATTCALVFCFGRRLPWRAYLDTFPEVQTVAILADAAEPDGTSVAQPACNALEGDLSWRVIYRAPVDAVMACEAVVYARIGEQ